VYDCYRLGVQCFINTRNSDIGAVFKAVGLISRGKYIFPGDADGMTRNVIRALNSEDLYKLETLR